MSGCLLVPSSLCGMGKIRWGRARFTSERNKTWVHGSHGNQASPKTECQEETVQVQGVLKAAGHEPLPQLRVLPRGGRLPSLIQDKMGCMTGSVCKREREREGKRGETKKERFCTDKVKRCPEPQRAKGVVVTVGAPRVCQPKICGGRQGASREGHSAPGQLLLFGKMLQPEWLYASLWSKNTWITLLISKA